jgi:transposase
MIEGFPRLGSVCKLGYTEGKTRRHELTNARWEKTKPLLPPEKPNNAVLYDARNRVERFFNRLKHFRAVATRSDKRATSYLATVLLTTIVLCL